MNFLNWKPCLCHYFYSYFWTFLTWIYTITSVITFVQMASIYPSSFQNILWQWVTLLNYVYLLCFEFKLLLHRSVFYCSCIENWLIIIINLKVKNIPLYFHYTFCKMEVLLRTVQEWSAQRPLIQQHSDVGWIISGMICLQQKGIVPLPWCITFTSIFTAEKPVQHTPLLVVLQLQLQLQFMGPRRTLILRHFHQLTL